MRSSPRRRAWGLLCGLVPMLRRVTTSRAVRLWNGPTDIWEQSASRRAAPSSSTTPRLDRMAGTTYLLMTDTHRAVPLLTQARDRRAPADAKGRALVTLDLADCHAVDHEPEDAVRLAVHALAAVDGSMVGPILTRARTLCAGLDRWSDLPTVRELDARLVVPPRG